MDKLFSTLHLLQGQGAGGTITDIVPTILMMAAVFGVFYFLIIRPQRKKQKDMKKLLEALKKGDKVVTIGGIRGSIQNVKEKTIVIKVDENTKIGANTKIWHFSHILSGSEIGKNCNIGQNVSIGPHVSIGNNCKIQNNVSIYKGITLEDNVFCGPSMVFIIGVKQKRK